MVYLPIDLYVLNWWTLSRIVSCAFKLALKNQQDILTFQGHLTQMIEGLIARSTLLSSIRNDIMVNDDSILTQLNWKSHPMKDFNKKMWITSSWTTNYVLHPPICQEGYDGDDMGPSANKMPIGIHHSHCCMWVVSNRSWKEYWRYAVLYSSPLL